MKSQAFLVAAVAVAAGASAVASSAQSSGWTVERYVATETWSSFADVGSKGAGPGDVYTSQQSLKTPAGKVVGTVNGFGVNLKPPFVFFHWTGSIAGSSLTIEGAINLHDRRAVYAIEGGTGRFAGVRGTVTLSGEGGKSSLVVLRYRR